jgi:hypothetical protein
MASITIKLLAEIRNQTEAIKFQTDLTRPSRPYQRNHSIRYFYFTYLA